MRIDLHCPVEMISYELLHDDRGKTRAYLKLANLSRHRVKSINASLHLADSQGNEETQKTQFCDIDAAPGHSFSLNTAIEVLPQAANLYLVFTRIDFDGDSPAWLGHVSAVAEIPDPQMLTGKMLDRLRKAAGPDAVCYPERRDDCWICLCARPNPFRRKTCMRCGRTRDVIFRQYEEGQFRSESPDDVSTAPEIVISEKAHSPSSNTRPQSSQALLRRHYLHQRSMLIRRSITMLIVIVLLLLGAWLANRIRSAKVQPDSIPPVKMQNHTAL